jgi:hypothetical protein
VAGNVVTISFRLWLNGDNPKVSWFATLDERGPGLVRNEGSLSYRTIADYTVGGVGSSGDTVTFLYNMMVPTRASIQVSAEPAVCIELGPQRTHCFGSTSLVNVSVVAPP